MTANLRGTRENAEPQVVILASGEGTRLRPFTLNRPKVLAPICNVSLLSRLLERLKDAGLLRSVLTLPPVSEEVRREIVGQAPSGFELETFSPARAFEGSFPSVMEVLEKDALAVLVIYGDSLLSLDFRAILVAHSATKSRGGLATVLAHRPADLCIAENDGRTYHGVMEVDGDSRITRFVEKPKVADIANHALANAAVFVCERAFLDHPRFKAAKDFSYDVFQAAVNEEVAPIHACSIGSGFRYDVGTIERFFDLNMRALRGDIHCSIPAREMTRGIWMGEGAVVGEEATITPPVLVGNDVRIGRDVRLGPDAVIGDRCTIEHGAVIRRAVTMQNCRVGAGAHIEKCILGMHARVDAGVTVPPFSVMGAYDVTGGNRWPV